MEITEKIGDGLNMMIPEIKKEPAECINEFLKAEREGFEPPVPLSTAVFKTAVIDHSTISPRRFVWS